MSEPVQYLMSRPAVFETGAYLRTSLDPDAVKREYLRAAQSDGQIDWNDVLDLAADPSSALHEAIDWDDSSAAAKQRRGVIVAIAWALRDKVTGERLFESLHYRTRNPEDVGRIRINVRVLPPSSVPEPQRYIVRARDRLPAPVFADVPVHQVAPALQTEVVDRMPEEERSIAIFQRWADAHKHEPEIIRTAIRILYQMLP